MALNSEGARGVPGAAATTGAWVGLTVERGGEIATAGGRAERRRFKRRYGGGGARSSALGSER
eukprot:15645254-Heterocapsa_arctica.AAC.1